MSKEVKKKGGEIIMNHFATVYFDGEPHDLRTELASGVKVYSDVMPLMGINIKDLSGSEKNAIESLIATVDGSDYISTILSGLLRGLAYSADEGLLPITAEPPFDKLIDPFLKVFETSNKNNIGSDLNTMKDVIFILSDEGVFVAIDSGNSTALSNVFTKEDENGKTVIRKVIDILTVNNHTKPLVATLTEISVAMLSESMGLDGETAQLYDNVKAGVKETLTIKSTDYATDEEYVEALSTSLNETLVANDINVEPEIVDSMAAYIKDNYKDLDEISDDEINDVILSYYDSYLEYQKNNPGGSGGGDVGGDAGGDVDGDNLGGYITDGDGNIDDNGIVG